MPYVPFERGPGGLRAPADRVGRSFLFHVFQRSSNLIGGDGKEGFVSVTKRICQWCAYTLSCACAGWYSLVISKLSEVNMTEEHN